VDAAAISASLEKLSYTLETGIVIERAASGETVTEMDVDYAFRGIQGL